MKETGGNEVGGRPSDACLKFHANLPAYLEGEARSELTAHSAECAFCGTLLADLEAIRSAASDLPLQEPPARVWAGILEALREEGLVRPQRPARTPRWAWWAWLRNPIPVAALAGLLALGFVTLRSRISPDRALKPAPAVAVEAAVDPGVERTVTEMEQAFRAQAVTLDPAVKTAYQQGLDSLDGEIRECRASLQRGPDDGLTREYLASAYTEKAQVLASALELNDR